MLYANQKGIIYHFIPSRSKVIAFQSFTDVAIVTKYLTRIA